MQSPTSPLKCYIAAPSIQPTDPYFEAQGFKNQLLVFAIPALGILFRCRVGGSPMELEFSAFFSLLRFIKDRLRDEKIQRVEVYSSNPEFVFSFSGVGGHIPAGSAREKLIREHMAEQQITVKYIAPHMNRTMISSADFPSLPSHRRPSIKPDRSDLGKTRIRPIQKGLIL